MINAAKSVQICEKRFKLFIFKLPLSDSVASQPFLRLSYNWKCRLLVGHRRQSQFSAFAL